MKKRVAIFQSCDILFSVMRDKKEQEYHVTLHATGFESGSGFKGFDSCRAYFFSAAPVGSEEFNKLREEKSSSSPSNNSATVGRVTRLE
jgi:hypothetical protein